MSKINVKALCRVGIMAALYVLLTSLSIKAGNLRITFASLPVVVLALLYGPFEGAAVALIGEFLNQVLSYGFTVTTGLWLIPPAVRGVIIGLVAMRLWTSARPLESRPAVYYPVCIGAAVVTTICNTAIIWLDSHIYHYYTFAAVFGTAAARFVASMVTAVVISTIAMPLVRLLRRQGLVQKA